MRRVITFICVFTVLAIALCVPVFADDSNLFSISNVQTYKSQTKSWTNRDFTWSSDVGGSYLLFVPNPTDSIYDGLRFSMNTPGYVRVPEGYVFCLNISFVDSTSLIDHIPSVDEFNLRVVCDNGASYSFKPTEIKLDGNLWTASFSERIGDGSSFRIAQLEFTTYLSSYLSQAYSVLVSTSLTTSITSEYQRHLQILEKLQAIYSGLSTDIKDQTDELTNGWENTGDEPADVGGATDDLGQAESDALGGKSDSEIKQEIDFVLSGNGLPSFDSAFAISSLFDDLLNALGAGYQSLLILSLTLGLAAFLIGRSWAKGG